MLTPPQKLEIIRYVLNGSSKAMLEDLDCLWESADPDDPEEVDLIKEAIEEFLNESHNRLAEEIKDEAL